jgi:hypothetical protein
MYLLIGLLSLLNATAGAMGDNTIINYPAGVRAIGMGEAYTAAEDDVFGVHYNPAIPLKTRQAGLLYEKGTVDDSFGSLGYGQPTRFGRLAGTIVYYDGGKIDLDDMMGNRRVVQAQRDFMGTFSAAVPLRPNLTVGGNAKILNTRLVSELTSTAYMADFGALYKYSSRFNLGGSIQNLGTPIKYGSDAQDLPRRLRVGALYKLPMYSHRLAFAFDAVYALNESELAQNVGLEYGFGEVLALRLGYKNEKDNSAFAVGFGFTRDMISIDFAFLPKSQYGFSEKLSITARF